MELAKVGTAGYDDAKAFNDKIYQVQLELVELLSDVYEVNKKASDALAPLVKITTVATTPSTGLITKPTDYLHVCSLLYMPNTGPYPCIKLSTNEISTTLSSPVRKPDLTYNETYYSYINDKLQMYPAQALPYQLIYCIVPPVATIILTPTTVTDEDYLVATLGADLIWPVSMFNLIVYLVLEKLGIEMKEDLLSAFSALGINRELIKTTAQ